MHNPFKRRPVVTWTITAGKSQTAAEAMLKMHRFTSLCLAHHVEIVSTSGATMTLRAREDRAERFRAQHEPLAKMGAV